MSKSGYTSQASWIAAAAQALQRRALDASAVPRAARTGDRAPVEEIAAAWRLVAAQTGDPAIGVRCGLLEFNPAEWQSLGLAVMCSASLRDALGRIVRYHRLVTDVARVSLREDGRRLEFVVDEFRLDPRQAGYEAAEYGVGATLALLRSISPRPLRPLQVELHRPEAEGGPAFAQLFGAPVRFGATRIALVLETAALDLPLPAANSTLAQYQDRFSEDYLRRYERGTFVLRVGDAILRQLPGGEPTQAQIAAEMHLSVRNLQRKLNDEGTGFTTLLRELRMRLAGEYLAQPNRPLCEVAYLLGFTDQSNFSRAVRRWFGQSPTELRARLPGA